MNEKNKKLLLTYLLSISLVLYFISLFLPAYGSSSAFDSMGMYTTVKGITILMLGWITVFTLHLQWLANITFLVTLILVGFKNKKAINLSVITLLLCVSSFIHPLGDGLHIGYYFWLASFIFLLLYTLLFFYEPT